MGFFSRCGLLGLVALLLGACAVSAPPFTPPQQRMQAAGESPWPQGKVLALAYHDIEDADASQAYMSVRSANLIEQLDPATARRFSLKIGFVPLSAQQREACFRRFFKSDPPSDLWALDQLTPGDFAVVAKRSKLLGITQPDALLVELRREQAAKPNTRNPIGFRAAS